MERKLKLKFLYGYVSSQDRRRYLSYFEYISSASCGRGVLFPAIRGRYYLSFLIGVTQWVVLFTQRHRRGD
jgi:hypothetical protein